MRRTSALAIAATAALGLGFAPTGFFTEHADQTEDARVFEPAGTYDHDHDCLQLTGPAAAEPTAPLGGDDVNLHVRLVLDLAESRSLDATPQDSGSPGDERQQAIDAFGRQLTEDFLAEGEQSYADIGVTLDYASFDVLEAPDLRSGQRAEQLEGQEAIDLAKDQYGGVRPPGTDIVYVLSDRDLTTGGSSALAGLADCIGGVTFPDRAFATGELDRDPNIDLVVADAYVEYTAKVAAHEVGHLMGAHHHYQACGPYAVTNYVDGYGIGGCTLMTNFVDFVSFPFSPTNQVVVRGHADHWAADNDDAAGADGEAGADATDEGHDDHDH